MPSFDIVSEVDMTEVKNAVIQTKKELQNRFDFRGTEWEIEEQKDLLVLHAQDEFKLNSLSEILMGKLAKRNVSLKNIDPQKTEVSSVGRARQELKIRQGLETEKAKEIIALIKKTGLKIQSQIQDGKVRVTGKNRDDLQETIQFVRGQDLSVAVSFNNFRD